ncbi:glycosyltransferase family 2 protein [soil metagenome]
MSDNLPLVSIITPSYNQAEFLEATILSVLNQDYPNIEYMIMDGGSTDHSVEIIRKYADRLAHWESGRDGGQANAVNKGLQRATGSLLGWINSDDVYLPGAISRIVQTFQAAPEIDVVYGQVNRMDYTGKVVPTPVLPKDTIDISKATVINENLVNQPGSFWRRAIMEKVGLLNESLHYAMDHDYWIRLTLAGAQFRRIPDPPLVNFRLSAHSKTVSQQHKMALEHLKLLNQLAQDPDLPQKLGLPAGEVRQRLRRAKALYHLYAFYGNVKAGRRLHALRWLSGALALRPTILLDRRWRQLLRTRRQRTTTS